MILLEQQMLNVIREIDPSITVVIAKRIIKRVIELHEGADRGAAMDRFHKESSNAR